MSTPAIEVRDVRKRYGDRVAVAGLDLVVERGETFALLGRNGAGKTTSVEIMEGYRRADSGTVRVLGFDPESQAGEMKARTGIMPQEGGLYPAITPLESLRLFAHFYSQPRDPQELLTEVGLQAAAGTRYRRLSGGEKQRLSLALALLPRPELVFLDEPTAGMDPQGRRATWEIIRGLQRDGVTVFLTTHYLEEAERLANRVGILEEGRLVALDTPDALRGAGTVVRLRTASPVDEATLAQLPSAVAVQGQDGAYVIDTRDAPQLLVEVSTALRDLSISVLELRVGRGSLEEVFLQLVGTEGEV